jgi:hypothetical protein
MPINALWTHCLTAHPWPRQIKRECGEQQGMRTIADTPLCSIVGLVVLAALFLTIWVARDSSAGAGASPRAASASVHTATEPPPLQSARTHRGPVTHTSVPPEQLRHPQR